MGLANLFSTHPPIKERVAKLNQMKLQTKEEWRKEA
jgi:Zn-dependent protease with chaperone function